MSAAHWARDFDASPLGTVVEETRATGMASVTARVAARSQCAATWSSEMIATLCAGAVRWHTVPSASSRPGPTMTW